MELSFSVDFSVSVSVSVSLAVPVSVLEGAGFFVSAGVSTGAGFFTSFLLRGLRGGADTNHDRKITAKELFTFVHQGVVEKSDGKQHPVMWGQFDDNWVLMDWR